jgi:protein-S-isoprenylcysteine O-methyltransferase Ste14
MTSYLPAIAASAVLLFGGGWRAYSHRQQYGSSPIASFRAATWKERRQEIVIAVLAMLLLGEAVAWALWPNTVSSMSLVRSRAVSGVIVTGLGLALLIRAQSDLGASWRIGIDREARPGLVAHGLYRVSRNPIFLGVFIVVAGFVVLMPTALSFIIFVGLVAVIRRQVRAEERYLDEAYGTSYREYARRVGRFVPWLGTLR